VPLRVAQQTAPSAPIYRRSGMYVTLGTLRGTGLVLAFGAGGVLSRVVEDNIESEEVFTRLAVFQVPSK